MVFYGDESTAEMFKSTLIPFNDGIPMYEPGKRVLLDKAFKEAMFEIARDCKN